MRSRLMIVLTAVAFLLSAYVVSGGSAQASNNEQAAVVQYIGNQYHVLFLDNSGGIEVDCVYSNGSPSKVFSFEDKVLISKSTFASSGLIAVDKNCNETQVSDNGTKQVGVDGDKAAMLNDNTYYAVWELYLDDLDDNHWGTKANWSKPNHSVYMPFGIELIPAESIDDTQTFLLMQGGVTKLRGTEVVYENMISAGSSDMEMPREILIMGNTLIIGGENATYFFIAGTDNWDNAYLGKVDHASGYARHVFRVTDEIVGIFTVDDKMISWHLPSMTKLGTLENIVVPADAVGINGQTFGAYNDYTENFATDVIYSYGGLYTMGIVAVDAGSTPPPTDTPTATATTQPTNTPTITPTTQPTDTPTATPDPIETPGPSVPVCDEGWILDPINNVCVEVTNQLFLPAIQK